MTYAEVMATHQDPSPRRPTLGELYPQLTDEQLARAEENLRRYLANAVRIYRRLERDPEAMARFRALTGSRGCGRKEGNGRAVSEANDKATT